ncbi:uncharacterized protein LOC107404064 [Ziziphus jujuba]|uniref:Uncharacterized protein LOC107404064 n=1 Tax=Ziziphus jujuba TaxID=326968 RepID=A0A6P3YSH7_ZIZJJ|nr:uncharacterized protein LOC107404064 [Ziziphus jujuba]
MLSKKEIVHPSHSHPLSVGTDKRFINLEHCNVCRGYMKDFKDYYYCPKEECKYYLHIKCFKFKETTQEYHPLHPHHPLTLSFTNPNNNGEIKYECSFCRETKSGYFYHCGHHQCDFRIDLICSTDFEWMSSALLRRFEFQHFFHDHKLSPLKSEYIRSCNGCGLRTFDVPILGCQRCHFYLHPLCSQVPKEMVHPFHPQHTLTLLQKPPADELRCIACRKRIKDAFVLHCTQCPFNLDIGCAFLKPSVKHDRHKHLLAHFEKIDLDDVLCIACNKVVMLICFVASPAILISTPDHACLCQVPSITMTISIPLLLSVLIEKMIQTSITVTFAKK